jgi:hypothetical protein
VVDLVSSVFMLSSMFCAFFRYFLLQFVYIDNISAFDIFCINEYIIYQTNVYNYVHMISIKV